MMRAIATAEEVIVAKFSFCYYRNYMKPFDSTKKRREVLSALLTDPCEEVRTAAAESLERLEGIGSLPEVLEALKKGDLGTKVRALYALGRIGGEEVLPALVYCASRPEEDIRSVAVEVLGVLGLPGALPVLQERLKDSNPAIRAKAIAALGNFKPPALAAAPAVSRCGRRPAGCGGSLHPGAYRRRFAGGQDHRAAPIPPSADPGSRCPGPRHPAGHEKVATNVNILQ